MCFKNTFPLFDLDPSELPVRVLSWFTHPGDIDLRANININVPVLWFWSILTGLSGQPEGNTHKTQKGYGTVMLHGGTI